MVTLVRLLALTLLLVSVHVGSADAQISRKGESGAALGQYCPVAYAMMGKAVQGDPKYVSRQDSVGNYRRASRG